MVILGLERRSCGKLFNELYGNAVSEKSLAHPSYSQTVWRMGNMASLVPVHSSLAVLENFCDTLSISERTVSQSGEGAVGGEALEAKHTFFSAL